jgi:hypothetical protein
MILTPLGIIGALAFPDCIPSIATRCEFDLLFRRRPWGSLILAGSS